MKKFAIKIETGNKTYRYSSDSLRLEESIGGQLTEVDYIPYLEKMDPLVSSIDLEGSPSIPTVKVSLWDAHRDINTTFKDQEYESIKVTFYTISKDNEIESSFSGWMTDVSYSSGMTQFTIRSNEDEALDSIIKDFTYSSFQKVQVLNPKDVKLYGSWEILEDTPWTVEKFNQPKSRVAEFTPAGSTTLQLMRKDNLCEITIHDGVNYITDIVHVFHAHINPTGAALDQAVADSRARYGDLYPELGAGEYPNYNLAVISSSVEGTAKPDPGSQVFTQIIAYNQWSLVGGKVRLGGIPSTGPFRIKNAIDKWHVVAPIDCTMTPSSMQSLPGIKDSLFLKKDRLFVRANGMVPVSASSSNLGYGFISLGMDGEASFLAPIEVDEELGEEVEGLSNAHRGLQTGMSMRKKNTKVFHRYSLAGIIQDGDPNNPILVLDLHCRTVDRTQLYRLDPKAGPAYVLGSYEMPVKLQKDHSVKLVNFNWTVGEMDFHIPNVDDATRELILSDIYNNESASFVDRLRGNRIDMIDNYSDLEQAYRRGPASDSMDYSESNNNVINNATGKFAVAINSTIEVEPANGFTQVENFFEKAQFSLPPYTEDVLPLPTDVNLFGEIIDIEYANRLSLIDNYMNYMTYSSSAREKVLYPNFGNPSFDYTIEIVPSDAGYLEAKGYFLSKLYRTLHDPVPENATDLGKHFPIVYGYVEKIPMVHVISKKVLQSKDKNTAGDDVYIFSAHPCNVKTPFDIKIHLIDDQGESSSSSESERDYLPSVRNSIIQSPFPNRIEEHWEAVVSHVDWLDEDGQPHPDSFTLDPPSVLYHPYHNVDTFETVDGFKLQGVKLRGGEWKHQAGQFDKRYPIRNGVGNTPLYASFAGYEDPSGYYTGVRRGVIEHHLDIVVHYIMNYGRYQGQDLLVDIASWQSVKGKTPKLVGSVFMSEGPMKVSELLSKVKDQFGTFWYLDGGKVVFTRPDLEVVDYSNPISDGLNLMNGISEDSSGYKKIYNEVVFNYSKQYHSEGYEGRIYLNKGNNYYCSQADKARHGKETLIIEADFVNSHQVASECSDYIAKMLCSRKAIYSLPVKYTDGISFKPGQYVPLTSKELGMDEVPVLITSVKMGRDHMDIEVTRFFNLM